MFKRLPEEQFLIIENDLLGSIFSLSSCVSNLQVIFLVENDLLSLLLVESWIVFKNDSYTDLFPCWPISLLELALPPEIDLLWLSKFLA